MAYVIITGGGGFLGQCVATSLLTTKSIQRYSSTTESSTSPTETIPVEKIILGDIAFPPKLQPFLEQNQDTFVVKKTGHVSDSTYVTELYSEIPPTAQHVYIFHLDAVVSSDDECDFDLCMRVNFHGFLNMMEGARNHIFERLKIVPKFLLVSAKDTIGSGAPTDYVQTSDVISDASRATLHTTYGAIKACCELLLTDYSSRGFVAGRSVLLPTEVLGYNRTVFLPAVTLSPGELVGVLKKMVDYPSSHAKLKKITYQAYDKNEHNSNEAQPQEERSSQIQEAHVEHSQYFSENQQQTQSPINITNNINDVQKIRRQSEMYQTQSSLIAQLEENDRGYVDVGDEEDNGDGNFFATQAPLNIMSDNIDTQKIKKLSRIYQKQLSYISQLEEEDEDYVEDEEDEDVKVKTFSSEVVGGFPTQVDAQRAIDTISDASISGQQQQLPIVVGSSIQGTSIQQNPLPMKKLSSLQRALAKDPFVSNTYVSSFRSKRKTNRTPVSKLTDLQSSTKSVEKPLSSLQRALQAKNATNFNPHKPVVATDDETGSLNRDTSHWTLSIRGEEDTIKTAESGFESDISSRVASVGSSPISRRRSKKKSKPKKR
eukprot:CAMPEP_0194395036 /NCGR_PEP_ID=MMETSP0174-20130528/124195_1 /TAXON_ID=216777 /ORGANISM="Proboscia alata, Strain PI-D3" /LENGTH=599 /DNA_ID=CAMNT_0039190917 /DNA_START=82 /DNA_END=1878 /DNA_ORIENTATION=+